MPLQYFYDSTIGKICKQDNIGVVEFGSGLRTRCGMGDFIRIKDVGRLSDVMRLLMDGVLVALVEEDVFETVFPPEKSK